MTGPSLSQHSAHDFLLPQPLTAEQGPHNPRFCNCPCHFLPIGRRSVGVQVKRTDPEPPRPRHYRLYFTPTTRGLQQGNLGTRSLALASRALFSQVSVGLCGRWCHKQIGHNQALLYLPCDVLPPASGWSGVGGGGVVDCRSGRVLPCGGRRRARDCE